MKRILIVAAIAIGVLATYVVAQQGQPAGAKGNCPVGMGAGKGMGMGQGEGMRCDASGPMHGARGPRGMRGGRGPGGGQGIGMLLMMADKLELTDQQKTQLEKMQNDFAMQQVDARAAREKAQIKMRNLLRDDKASESQVNAAIDELSKLRADMQKAHFAHLRQVRNVLTEKQQGMLKDLRDDRREARWERLFGFDDDDDDNAPAPMPGGGGADL